MRNTLKYIIGITDNDVIEKHMEEYRKLSNMRKQELDIVKCTELFDP